MAELRQSAGVLPAAGAVALVVLGGVAWGQQVSAHNGWADKDASGRPAAISFRAVHGPGFTHDRAVEMLTAAGCKREETETFIRFDCEVDPNRWYLTKPGRPEHPGLAVAADDQKDGSPQASHLFPLSEISLRPREPSVERREAFAVWSEGLPLQPNRPEPKFVAKPMDWDALFRDAPLTQAQMRSQTLKFEEAFAALEAAKDCKRETAASYVLFNCPASKTRWVFTREGQAVHRTFVLGAHRSYTLEGEVAPESFMPMMQKRYAADGQLMTAATIPPGYNEAVWAWIGTLPGFSAGTVNLPPLRFSLEGSPFTDKDIRPSGVVTQMLTYDSAMQKLTVAGCARKEAGEYVAFTCSGNRLLFVLSSADSPAHAAMMIAEPDRSGRAMQMLWSRQFFDRSKPQTDASLAAHNKWMRGISYLPMSQLR